MPCDEPMSGGRDNVEEEVAEGSDWELLVLDEYGKALKDGGDKPPSEWLADRVSDYLRDGLDNLYWLHRPGTEERIAGFEIVEEMGQGGMGVVYRAREVELDRLVALKFVQGRRDAAPADIRRFQSEARKASKLEHRNIVPIYVVDEHNGEPYFSMKLLNGGSFSDWQRQHFPQSDSGKADATAFGNYCRDAVELLAQVASAIEYAHDHGIIHRDLKPSNILLDGDGTPYVTDFGLAKHVEDDGSLTGSGDIVGTPHYMAPEQARGEKTPSKSVDVYSLGTILYEALTGKVPFCGVNPIDTIIQVCDEAKEPHRPRKLNPQVHRDLEAICVKCLEKNPEGRYPSAADLEKDLRNWLEGRPVDARPVGRMVSAWRMCRRHPLATMLFATVIVFPLTLAAVVWFAYVSTSAALEESERLRTQGRDLAHSLIFDLDEKIRDLPGAMNAREFLADKAHVFLRSLADEAQDDSRLLRDLAASYCKLGDIQGNPLQRNLGKTDGAMESYSESLQIWQTLAETEANELDVQRHIAVVHNRIAEIQRVTGQVSQALGTYLLALEITEGLAKANPDDGRFQNDLVVSHQRLGDVYLELGDTGDARQHFEAAMSIVAGLEKDGEETVPAKRRRAVVRERLGQLAMRMGHPNEATDHFQAALEVWRQLKTEDELNIGDKRSFAVALETLGDLKLKEGTLREASPYLRESFEIFRSLTEAEPQDVRAAKSFAISCDKLGTASENVGEYEAALEFYKKAQSTRVKLRKLSPKDTEVKREEAVSYERVGDMNMLRGMPADAYGAYLEALKIREELAKESSDSMVVIRDLSACHDKLGSAATVLGRLSEARGHHEKMIEIRTRIVRADLEDQQAKRYLSVAYNSLGDTVLKLGDADLARVHYSEGRKIAEELLAADQDSVQAKRDLAVSHQRLGKACAQLGESNSAAEHFAECMRLSREVYERDPDNLKDKRNFAIACLKAGDACQDQRESREHYERGLELCLSIVDANSADARCQRDVAIFHDRIGNLLFEANELAAAREHYKKSEQIREQLHSIDPRNRQAKADLDISRAKLRQLDEACEEAGEPVEQASQEATE